MSLMICSTSHQQKGVRLLFLVAGAVLACVSTFIVLLSLCACVRACVRACVHFMVYSVETVTETF